MSFDVSTCNKKRKPFGVWNDGAHTHTHTIGVESRVWSNSHRYRGDVRAQLMIRTNYNIYQSRHVQNLVDLHRLPDARCPLRATVCFFIYIFVHFSISREGISAYVPCMLLIKSSDPTEFAARTRVCVCVGQIFI